MTDELAALLEHATSALAASLVCCLDPEVRQATLTALWWAEAAARGATAATCPESAADRIVRLAFEEPRRRPRPMPIERRPFDAERARLAAAEAV